MTETQKIGDISIVVTREVVGGELVSVSIIELFGHCKGGNCNNHIWAWFSYFIC